MPKGEIVGMFIRQVCLSLMARSEYAAMEKQGQRKLTRESAMVHAECKSVLVHLMENRQARKISSAGIMARKDQKRKLHFRVSDTGKLRSQELRLFNTGVPELRKSEIPKGAHQQESCRPGNNSISEFQIPGD
jgi:hypothetical protein